MGRQPLQQADCLVEVIERAIGVGLLAEQRDAGLRHVLRRVAAKLR
jgi:hypothetical protein